MALAFWSQGFGRIVTVVCVGAAAAACGGPDSAPGPEPLTPAVASTPAVAGTAASGVEPGVRATGASASVVVPDGSGGYLMYLPGLEAARSADGLSFSRTRITLAEPGELLRNPAIARLADGTTVMIYEGVSGQRTASRATRFYRAISGDGANFVKTPGAGTNGAVMDPGAGDGSFISAPDLIVLGDGSWRMYFNVDDGRRIEAARSTDEGRTWTREGAVTIAGLPAAAARPADPDIVREPKGGFRLYFATELPGVGGPRIYTATSADGIAFTFEPGEVLPPATGVGRVDPDVVLLPGGGRRIYFAEGATTGGPYSIRSALLP